MGADVIIGVDIQSGLDKKDNLNSAVAIINQIVGFQMYKTLDYKYGKVDVLIKPDVTSYNVISFDKKKEIMKAGDIAAREQMDNLRTIAKQQTTKETSKIDTKQLQYDISDIRIQGNLNYTRAYILGKLNLKKQDKTDYNKLIQSINNLYATGNFENIQYKILDDIENEEGSILSLKVKEHRISNYLQLGVHFDDLYKTGIIINSTAKHLFNKNDIISADIILGDNIRYNFDYFIDNGFYTSFGVKSRYNSFNANLNFEQTNSNIEDSNVNEINLVYEDFTNQLYFQTVFNRKFALGVGGEHKHLKVFTETISSLESTISANKQKRLYFDNSHYLNLIAYLKIDTYDKKYFQKYGVFLDVDFRWFLSSSDYNNNFNSFSQLKGKVGFAHTFFNKLTTHFISEAGITIGENNNRALNYNVGGYGENFINSFIPFYGYDLAELTANAFLKSGLTLRYEFLPKNYFSATANYARVESDLFNEGRIFENTKSGYMVGYGIDTFLGPIEINHTWSPDHSDNYWYFNVGYWF